MAPQMVKWGKRVGTGRRGSGFLELLLSVQSVHVRADYKSDIYLGFGSFWLNVRL